MVMTGRVFEYPLCPSDLVAPSPPSLISKQQEKDPHVNAERSEPVGRALTCSQYVNEKGFSIDELQMITDHARRESVLKYAAVQAEAKRKLMARVVKIGDRTGTEKKTADSLYC
ncbi:MAG: hypothetical protein CVU61_05060 [Deltaproteobacteria bacterium HGW-Deltaproteobacteria-19]|jgi:hypothetical protein|nr:MAG: hypothetical protein CVU61_05060 [Deltaproteobacteria bacterium HGW-Deltaproteobacteria-19]